MLASAVLLTAAVQVALLHHAHYMRLWQILLIPAALLASRRGAEGKPAFARRTGRGARTAAGGAHRLRGDAHGATPSRAPSLRRGPTRSKETAARVSAARSSPPPMRSCATSSRTGATGRYQLLTEASLTADTPILLGLRASALGGYGGVDPALNGPGLARLVASGQARYVFIGDGYSYLGGNAASRAAARVCPEVPLTSWRGVGAHGQRRCLSRGLRGPRPRAGETALDPAARLR